MEQLQPVPLIAVGVNPNGSASDTVTTPDVGPEPTLLTPIVYDAPTCPPVKLTARATAIVRSGGALMAVGSFALSFAVFTSPPPDTVTVFMTDAGALPATFRTIPMGG